MDWRPTSRSRSRPPELMATFDQHGLFANSIPFDNHYPFPTLDPSKSENAHFRSKPSSPGVNNTGLSLLSAARPSPSPYASLHQHTTLAAVYEGQADPSSSFDNSESRYMNAIHYNNSLSAFNSPTFAPSSLPSSGLHGIVKPTPEQRKFPRHVRKTSFDHTVSRDGVLAGLVGRHQVNGKPLSPDSLVGTKRRAETVHHDSLLRADPSNVDTSHFPRNQEAEPMEQHGPFPSSSFNFSFPPYDGIFDLPAEGGSSMGASNAFPSRTSPENRQYQARTPVNPTMYPSNLTSPSNTNDRLSASSVTASAAIAEGYARLSSASASGPDNLDYRQLMGLMYPNLDSSVLGQNPYTHVDPTQISAGQADNSTYQTFHPSPSSDGWGNGVNSSSNASPEPYNTSNASTPPSAEGPNGQQTARPMHRKYMPMQQGAQDIQNSKAMVNKNSPTLGEIRSSASTPDLGSGEVAQGKAASEEGDQTPTLCTNCHTTNTPLWRRDPEGQPLCAFLPAISILSVLD